MLRLLRRPFPFAAAIDAVSSVVRFDRIVRMISVNHQSKPNQYLEQAISICNMNLVSLGRDIIKVVGGSFEVFRS
jgi:hypothetical protein